MSGQGTWLPWRHISRLGWLALGGCVAVVLWAWFIHTAISEWRQSAAALAERRADVAAHTLHEALVRDMRGVQREVLSARAWTRFDEQQAHELSPVVASAFARYPYAESFFIWQPGSETGDMLFFNRSDRLPPWEAGPQLTVGSRFPVEVSVEAAPRDRLMDRIEQDAADGHSFSVFETEITGISYQVVAEINYVDAFREQVDRVVGFTVSLPWVREFYFAEILRQVSIIGADDSGEVSLAVLDGEGAGVAGAGPAFAGAPATRQEFPLAFFDPVAVAPRVTARLSPRPWMVEVSAAGDPTYLRATRGATGTLWVAVLAAGALVVGLTLTIRAERAKSRLADLRSEFIAGEAHELKTPIASIRAAADTLRQGRLADPAAVRDYSAMIATEAKRLGRVVENLLFHARIADVSGFYRFEPVDLAALFREIAEEFRIHFEEHGLRFDVDIPATLPGVRGDEWALRLLFDNLVDNAIKYSATGREVRVSASEASGVVHVEVADDGVGIPPEELANVVKRFVRGTRTSQGGSGLGLAIASRIARDHEGALTLRSEPGHGTTVSVQLPSA